MNNTDNIFTLSLLRLLSEGKLNSSNGCLYKDDCYVTIKSQPRNMESDTALFPTPTRLDCYIMFLCAEGEANITCNMKNITIGEHSIFFSQPGSIIQVNSYSQLRSASIIFSEHLFERLNISLKNVLPHIGTLNEMNTFTLKEEQFQYMWKQVELVAESIRQSPSNAYYDEVICQTIGIVAYNFYSQLIYKLEECERKFGSQVNKHDEEIFRRFIRLVKDHYRTERRISFYAGRMHLTPKYLSGVIRRSSGHGPSEWISQNILVEAKNMLRYSNMSIQEITYALSFPNQSFFGRWFKVQTGYSPRSYREKA